MTAVTALVVFVASVVIWIRRPSEGLAVFTSVLLLYPQYLAVSLGPVDWTSGRLLTVVLLIRIITRPVEPHLLRFRWMDLFVIAAFTGRATAHFVTEPWMQVIEREGGWFFDTVLFYFVFRLSMRRWSDLQVFVNTLIYCSVVLAFIGVYQSITGHNPYGILREYSPFNIGVQEMRIRHGLYRANAAFENKISFGLLFSLVLSLHLAFYFVGRRRQLRFAVISVILVAGAVSSMSSAPLFALVVTLGFIAVYPVRHYWPYCAILVGATVLAVELYSDEHFYNALTRFAFSQGNANYRIGLVEEALGGGMSGHWIAGYGYVDYRQPPGHNGWYWHYRDLVNIYIGILCRTGLLGLLPYVALNFYYFWALYRSGCAVSTGTQKWVVWCIAGGLIGWNVAMFTVGPLEQTGQLLYAMMAIIVALKYIGIESYSVPQESRMVRWSRPHQEATPIINLADRR